MKLIDPDDLEAFCGLKDIDWHGYYRGRYGFEGYALRFDSLSDMVRGVMLIAASDDFPGITNLLPHCDNMGRGVIVAFPLALFSGTPEREE